MQEFIWAPTHKTSHCTLIQQILTTYDASVLLDAGYANLSLVLILKTIITYYVNNGSVNKRCRSYGSLEWRLWSLTFRAWDVVTWWKSTKRVSVCVKPWGLFLASDKQNPGILLELSFKEFKWTMVYTVSSQSPWSNYIYHWTLNALWG